MDLKFWLCVAVLIAMAVFGERSAKASNVFFDLITPDGVNMARLELRNGSGNHNEFVGLTFTEAGQTALGYPEIYTGTMDRMGSIDMSEGFFQQGSDGLTGRGLNFISSALMIDLDPPRSSILSSDRTQFSFALLFQDFMDAVIISHHPSDEPLDQFGANEESFAVSGHWTRAVPEPNAGFLCGAGLVLVSLSRRRRQQHR